MQDSTTERSGPLARLESGFARVLAESGYAAITVYQQGRVMMELSDMLERDSLGLDDLTDEVVGRFLLERRSRGSEKYVTVRGLAPLMAFLRSIAVVPPAVVRKPTSSCERSVEDYRLFLINERGLAPRSIAQCCHIAERFAGIGPDTTERDLRALRSKDVAGFIDSETIGMAPASIGHVLWSLRSFLKFLFLDGVIDQPLADSVPAIRIFSQASLPDPITASEARSLVNSCNTNTAIGRRDRAIIMLLSRLGMRSGEVTRLTLDNIDWRNAQLTVAGKGGRRDLLPLPSDISEAIADYLRDGRPAVAPTRAIFVGSKAPFLPLTPSGAMNRIVGVAAERARLGPISPHRLRHGAASQMLADGAGLAEIGQVLRHRQPASTAIYAKVDHGRLERLTRPWPKAVTS